MLYITSMVIFLACISTSDILPNDIVVCGLIGKNGQNNNFTNKDQPQNILFIDNFDKNSTT